MLPQVGRLAVMAGGLARANVQRLPAPLKVNLALTYWCQYRCKTCNIWQRRPTDELRTDEVLAFIARNRAVSWLDVTGGEIFLRPDIGDLLDAIVGTWTRLAVLHFPTNGFLTDRIAAVCARIARRGAPPIVVTVSVDGDEALNDEVRGIRGGFVRQMETFRALRQIPGVRPFLGMTLSAHNLGRVRDTFDACRRACPDLDPGEFHLNVAQVSSHYYGNADAPGVTPEGQAAVRDLRLYRSMRRVPVTPAEWLEATYARHLERFLQTGVAPMRCHALRSSCFIDPWGTVYPCITYARPLGSLRDTDMDLGPIWTAAATAGVQREIWDGDCPTCWTACEAYQSILGNLLRPGRLAVPPVRTTRTGDTAPETAPDKEAAHAR